MHTFDHGPLRFERELAGAARHRQGDAPGLRNFRGVETVQLARRRSGAKHAEGRGRVETAFYNTKRIRSHADTRHDLVTRDDGAQQLLARRTRLGSGGERGGNDDGARVAHGFVMRVVQFIAVRGRAVDHRRRVGARALAAADQQDLAVGAMVAGPLCQGAAPGLHRSAQCHGGIIEQKPLQLLMIFP